MHAQELMYFAPVFSHQIDKNNDMDHIIWIIYWINYKKCENIYKQTNIENNIESWFI